MGRTLQIVAVAASLCGAVTAQAAQPEKRLIDDGIHLGPLSTFESEDAARATCAPDAVVWADRRTGYYYPRFMPEYGRSPDGAFACYQAAQGADYWGFGTGTSMNSRRNRTFPVSPDPFCDYRVDKTSGKGFCAKPGV